MAKRSNAKVDISTTSVRAAAFTVVSPLLSHEEEESFVGKEVEKICVDASCRETNKPPLGTAVVSAEIGIGDATSKRLRTTGGGAARVVRTKSTAGNELVGRTSQREENIDEYSQDAAKGRKRTATGSKKASTTSDMGKSLSSGGRKVGRRKYIVLLLLFCASLIYFMVGEYFHATKLQVLLT